MKNWSEAKSAYIKDHLSKPLKQPERRLHALAAIKRAFNEKDSGVLKDKDLFSKLNQDAFLKKYLGLKGKALSNAEKSVIRGIYKFAI